MTHFALHGWLLAVTMNYIHMCVSHGMCLQVRGIDISCLAFYVTDVLRCVSSVTKEIKHTLMTSFVAVRSAYCLVCGISCKYCMCVLCVVRVSIIS